MTSSLFLALVISADLIIDIEMDEVVLKRIKISLLVLGLALGIMIMGQTAFAARTVNYGAFARSGENDHINFSFRFNKRLTHVSKEADKYFGNVAVYDTKIQNKSPYNIRFYFSKLWFVNLGGYRLYDQPVSKPKLAVIVKSNTTKIIKNSFRDDLNIIYSYFQPAEKKQFVIQYYGKNQYYLARINGLHSAHKHLGWYPTWKWSQ